jgi:sulfite reductase beta subunit-like hemoprotein
VAQELFAGFKGIYPHEPVFARLRLPHGTMESSDLRVLLDGVIAQRDGTAKP